MADDDDQKKIYSDPALEADLQAWITQVTGESFDPKKSFGDNLNNGQILCKLANKLEPGAIKKMHKSNMAFMKMENIGWFCDFLHTYGVQSEYVFVTVDLFEQKNMRAVLIGLDWLRKKSVGKGFLP